MKTTAIVGIILIAVGALALIFPSVTYTEEEHVFDVGPLKATVEEKETIPIPKVLGGIAIAGGVALVLLGQRNSRRP